MVQMIPKSRPQANRFALGATLHTLGYSLENLVRQHGLVIVGIRGYYRDTMGLPGVNDRGIYDDAIFVVSADSFVAYNANTDPSRVRKGQGTGGAKGMASLKTGLWLAHGFGMHKGQYPALIQIKGAVTVTRDGNPPYDDSGYFGINIHRGGYNTTSSEGCQTIHPNQWQSFIALVQDLGKRLVGGKKLGSMVVPYLLVENPQ